MIDSSVASTTHPQNKESQCISSRIKAQDGDLSRVLQKLLHSARLHLNMDVSFISHFQNSQCILSHVDQAEGINCLKVESQTPQKESHCQKVIEGMIPQLSCNAQDLLATQELPIIQQLGMGAYVSIPIELTDGSTIGSFCCFSLTSNYSLDQRDLALMKAFADVAGTLLETDLKTAIVYQEKRKRVESLLEEDLISIVYQPINNVRSGKIVGLESLARFNTSPVHPPNIWFKEAQSVGLAEALEQKAMKKGLEILENLPRITYIACNISANALLAGKTIEFLSQMPLERIVLEITEHDIINDYKRLGEALTPLRKQGMRVAIDDMGTGYASFQHILNLEPDLIKLDMSLTRNIDSDSNRQVLAQALVTFAHQTNTELIAEGVETTSELNMLKLIGVNNIQGYLLHKPMTKEHCLPLLASN